MRLSRPFFSHRLTPSAIRTVVQCAEAGVLLLLFRLVSGVVGAFVFGDAVRLTDELLFGAVIIAGCIVGGAIYVLLRDVVTRHGGSPNLGVRIVLVLMTGAALGAALSLNYWRRPAAPGNFSHEALTLLASVAGALVALVVGAVVVWQDRTE